MNSKIFTKIYFGLSYSYADDLKSRGRVVPLYFCPLGTEKLLHQAFLEILDKEPLEKIKDFSPYSLQIEALARLAGISVDVQRIKDRLHEASKLLWEQILRDGKAEKRVDDLVKQADIYSILADHHIWQRRRFMMAIRNLLRNVIEEGKTTWCIGEEEEVEFNQGNLDFERIEKICYELIEAGEVKEGLYILESMKEKIADPLIRACLFWYHDQEEAIKLFRRYEKEIKGRMNRWFQG